METIESVNVQTAQSGQALEEIVALIESSSDQVRAIATASEEQTATSEEINRTIENVSVISAQTAEAMAQSAHAVSELASQAGALRDLIAELEAESGRTTA